MRPTQVTDPHPRALAEFAAGALIAGGLVAAPLAFHRGRPLLAEGLWLTCCLAGAVGLLRPGWLRRPYVVLTALTRPFGSAAGVVSLAAVYFLVVTPTGLARRLAGRDPLGRRFDPGAGTYWSQCDTDTEPERYLRQF